jgi:hypothetical protein
MLSFEIDKENLLGVWENRNIEPNNYNDNSEITLYLGANYTSSIRIKKTNADDYYFSDGFDLIKPNRNSNDFKIIFKNSELNNGKDLIVESKLYTLEPLVFKIDFLDYGNRYIERL